MVSAPAAGAVHVAPAAASRAHTYSATVRVPYEGVSDGGGVTRD